MKNNECCEVVIVALPIQICSFIRWEQMCWILHPIL